MVRSNSLCSNFDNAQKHDKNPPDFEAVFDELERWNDVLKDHKNTLLGPKP
jgi:hypothetical protein